MSARLIIVRHAQASGNLEGRFQARVNTELTELGRLQLKQLTARLQKETIDAVYSSPLSRAMQTAEACIGSRDLSVIADDRLTEIDAGLMDGLLWDELYEKFPEQMELWKNHPHLFVPPQGEPMIHVRERISSAVLDIAAGNEGRTVVIASHGVTIRNLMCWAKGLAIERLVEMERWNNTGIGIIEITDGIPVFISENDHAHLAALDGQM